MNSDEIKERVLQYHSCPLGDLHEGEQLNLVCLDPQCKETGLICPICRTQKHQKHKVTPLKFFLSDISGIESNPIGQDASTASRVKAASTPSSTRSIRCIQKSFKI